MMMSVDGRILPSRWTRSPDGERSDWAAVYADMHEKPRRRQGWIVGRVTMAEMSRARGASAGELSGARERPHHFATNAPAAYAIARRSRGEASFRSQADIEGDAVVVLLGAEVSDAHLAELAASDGVSYMVSPVAARLILRLALDLLNRELGAAAASHSRGEAASTRRSSRPASSTN